MSQMVVGEDTETRRSAHQTQDVVAVSLSRGLALRSDDVVGRIILLLDGCGEDTEDRDDAVVAVVEWPESGYAVVVLSDYDTALRH